MDDELLRSLAKTALVWERTVTEKVLAREVLRLLDEKHIQKNPVQPE